MILTIQKCLFWVMLAAIISLIQACVSRPGGGCRPSGASTQTLCLEMCSESNTSFVAKDEDGNVICACTKEQQLPVEEGGKP